MSREQQRRVSPLRIGYPDLVEGRNGLELRGSVWKDQVPQVSFFVLKWNAVGASLLLETDSGSLASELKAIFEAALKGEATAAKGSARRQMSIWDLPSRNPRDLSRSVGSALGGDWEKAIEQLLTTDTSGRRPEIGVLWYGIPREQVPWYPTVDLKRCDGCGKCVEYCSHGVFRMEGEPLRPEVINPLNCLVGCDSCARVCPEEAILFPPRDVLKAIRP